MTRNAARRSASSATCSVADASAVWASASASAHATSASSLTKSSRPMTRPSSASTEEEEGGDVVRSVQNERRQRGSPAPVGGRCHSGRPFCRSGRHPYLHDCPREAIAANRSSDACAEWRRFVAGGERRREAVYGQITPSSWHISLLSFSCMLVNIYLSLA
jgi:hypothetical protein